MIGLRCEPRLLILLAIACGPLTNEALLPGGGDTAVDSEAGPWPLLVSPERWSAALSVEPLADLWVCPDRSTPFSTIAAALARAEDGATLHLCAATFHEQVVLEGFRVLHLTGDDPAGPAILSGDSVGLPLTVANGAGTSTDISGVWFEDGWGTVGGGCVRVDSSPTSISHFVARRCYAHYGGGVAFVNVTGGNLYDGVVRDSHSQADGGGLYAVGGSVGVWNVDFNENSAVDRGGHVFVAGSYGIRNSIFTEGSAGGDGVAIYLAGSGAAEFNTVAWNNDTDRLSIDFAVETDDRWGNNIVAGNASAGLKVSATKASYNLSFGNAEADFEFEGPIGPGPTDLNEDPLLPTDDVHVDVHLSEGSPAIDAGDPDPELDDADGTRADLGAFGGPGGDPTLSWLPEGGLDP